MVTDVEGLKTMGEDEEDDDVKEEFVTTSSKGTTRSTGSDSSRTIEKVALCKPLFKVIDEVEEKERVLVMVLKEHDGQETVVELQALVNE